MSITIKKSESDSQMYCHYPRQTEAQPAYVELDLDDETLEVSYNSAIGNAVPSYVWHNKAHRFCVPALKADAANKLMEEILPECEKILEGYEEKWDGNNFVGTLTEEAQSELENLEYSLASRDFDPEDMYSESEENEESEDE